MQVTPTPPDGSIPPSEQPTVEAPTSEGMLEGRVISKKEESLPSTPSSLSQTPTTSTRTTKSTYSKFQWLSKLKNLVLKMFGFPIDEDKIIADKIRKHLDILKDFLHRYQTEKKTNTMQSIQMELKQLKQNESEARKLAQVYYRCKSLDTEIIMVEYQTNHLDKEEGIATALENFNQPVNEEEIISRKLENFGKEKELLNFIGKIIQEDPYLKENWQLRVQLKNLGQVTAKNVLQIMQIAYPDLAEKTRLILEPHHTSITSSLSILVGDMNEKWNRLQGEISKLNLQFYSLSPHEQTLQAASFLENLETLQTQVQHLLNNEDLKLLNKIQEKNTPWQELLDQANKIYLSIENNRQQLKMFHDYLKIINSPVNNELIQSSKLELMSLGALDLERKEKKNLKVARIHILKSFEEFVKNELSFNDRLSDLLKFKQEIDSIVQNPTKLSELEVNLSMDVIKEIRLILEPIEKIKSSNDKFVKIISELKNINQIPDFIQAFLSADFSPFLAAKNMQTKFNNLFSENYDDFFNLFNKIRDNELNNFKNKTLNFDMMISGIFQRVTRYPVTLKELNENIAKINDNKDTIQYLRDTHQLTNQALFQARRIGDAVNASYIL